MKKPRVSDFDPNAKEELTLKSSFENLPVIQKPNSVQTEAKATPVPPVRVVPPIPHAPSRKRIMKQRHPFDIYQDQYESLKHLATEDRKEGGIGSMSAMVREALDTYIATHKKK